MLEYCKVQRIQYCTIAQLNTGFTLFTVSRLICKLEHEKISFSLLFMDMLLQFVFS
jgi:hypothetical protein